MAKTAATQEPDRDVAPLLVPLAPEGLALAVPVPEAPEPDTNDAPGAEDPGVTTPEAVPEGTTAEPDLTETKLLIS